MRKIKLQGIIYIWNLKKKIQAHRKSRKVVARGWWVEVNIGRGW